MTHVEIFDDRVVISNPGGLVNSVSKQEFGIKSFSRNPLVFSMFQRMNLVEKVGSGINRMRDEMRSASLPEPEYSLDGMFTAIFYRPVIFEQWMEKAKDSLTNNQLTIIRQMHSNATITRQELAENLDMSVRGIDNNLLKLKAIGIISREGSDKSGLWKLNLVKF